MAHGSSLASLCGRSVNRLTELLPQVVPEFRKSIYASAYRRACAIQYPTNPGTGWTDVFGVAKFRAMTPLNLSDDELQDAAQAARIASVQAESDSDKQSSPRVKAMFDSSARRWRELAKKFETARLSR
jgi:hypothetical protein